MIFHYQERLSQYVAVFQTTTTGCISSFRSSNGSRSTAKVEQSQLFMLCCTSAQVLITKSQKGYFTKSLVNPILGYFNISLVLDFN